MRNYLLSDKTSPRMQQINFKDTKGDYRHVNTTISGSCGAARQRGY